MRLHAIVFIHVQKSGAPQEGVPRNFLRSLRGSEPDQVLRVIAGMANSQLCARKTGLKLPWPRQIVERRYYNVEGAATQTFFEGGRVEKMIIFWGCGEKVCTNERVISSKIYSDGLAIR
jgi:hypothetical protein